MARTSQRVVGSGDSFERHVEVDAPCVLAFRFHVEPADAPLTFSVALRSADGRKHTRLLPASSHSELSGEVLLPTPGARLSRAMKKNLSLSLGRLPLGAISVKVAPRARRAAQ